MIKFGLFILIIQSYMVFAQATTRTNNTQELRLTLIEVNEVFNHLNNPFQFSERHLDFLGKNVHYLIDPKTTKAYATNALRKIPYYYFPPKEVNNTTKTIIWVGGVHADEFAPTLVSWRFLLQIIDSPSNLPRNHHLIYVPMLNLDGWIDGHRKYGYPTRKNGRGIDLNRSFYDRTSLPSYRAESETEFIMDLIEKYHPQYWIIPHSTLNILDLDGNKSNLHLHWVQQIHQATSFNGASSIPIKSHGTYSPPNSRKNWSIGKLANERAKSGVATASLTYEFGGPGKYPAPNDPDRALKISKRKHLGRYEDNTHIADQYFSDYSHSLKVAIDPKGLP